MFMLLWCRPVHPNYLRSCTDLLSGLFLNSTLCTSVDCQLFYLFVMGQNKLLFPIVSIVIASLMQLDWYLFCRELRSQPPEIHSTRWEARRRGCIMGSTLAIFAILCSCTAIVLSSVSKAYPSQSHELAPWMINVPLLASLHMSLSQARIKKVGPVSIRESSFR